MDVKKMLTALRQEHAQIEEVIMNLELLAQTRERRRGRPPAILAAARKRGRPRGSKNKTPRRTTPLAAVAQHASRAMAVGHVAATNEPVMTAL